MSARRKIVNTLVDLCNDQLNGTTYTSNIEQNAIGKQIFWDEVNTYPYISITAGNESRQYLPGNFKWGYLEVNIKVYVEDQEDAQALLEQFFEDLESLLDANNELAYDTGKVTELISIISIATDEGVLTPLGVGELSIQIQYDV